MFDNFIKRILRRGCRRREASMQKEKSPPEKPAGVRKCALRGKAYQL
jgi:hypothetical protein